MQAEVTSIAIDAHRQKVAWNVRHALHRRYLEIFTGLTPLLWAKDRQLYLHSRRLLSLTIAFSRILDLSDEEIIPIALASYFHDVGKLAIDDAVLSKTTALTQAEYTILQQHPAHGANMLSQYASTEAALPLILYHHERWDGKGYPAGLAGEAIPLGARIIAITDAFDAMTSGRPYQARRTSMEAIGELMRCAGTQFDERLVKLFAVSVGFSTLSLAEL
ncbi:MAG TPA: HD domain-containing phosphohydrolase [Ktedonobacteraceae bacterium]|nr:HD domain-containing phosphohydrolase [Ktedonobacteraceae bacterium]